MLTLCRYSVIILLLLGLSSGVGGQASPATSVELGDITEETAAQFVAGEVAAVGDTVSYAFTLSAPRRVALGIRQQDTNADLVVVDASAAEVGRSATAGTANELVRLALGPGSYRAHVVAQAAGVNAYRLRYRVKAVEDDYGADVDTSGTLLVGESTTGAVDYVGDEDWFFIDLEAVRTYTLSVTGTASVPVMVGVYAATGTEVVAGVSGLESAVATFTPDTTALYYVAVAATDIQTGAYTLSVTDSTPAPAPAAAAPAESTTSAAPAAAAAPTEARSSPPPPLWVGEMRVAVETSTHPAYQGYSRWSQHGSLSAVPSTPARPPILALVQHAGGVYLGLSPALESDFTLTVGTQTFTASASAIPAMAGGGRYWWADAGPPWLVGAVLAVSLTPVAGEPALGPRPLAPPTAHFAQVPSVHDGTTPISVRLYFGEDGLVVDAARLRDHALAVTGGTVTQVAAVTAGATRIWQVTVQPDGVEDVTVAVAGGVACEQPGAVCAPDGRMLYNSPQAAILGPPWLSGLALTGLAPLAFNPAVFRYDLTAVPGVTESTVVVNREGLEAGATVEVIAMRAEEFTFDSTDADPHTAGHQIRMSAGRDHAGAGKDHVRERDDPAAVHRDGAPGGCAR